MAFRMTDADVVRVCTIGNRAVASRGSSHLSPRRKSKEPLSRRVIHDLKLICMQTLALSSEVNKNGTIGKAL